MEILPALNRLASVATTSVPHTVPGQPAGGSTNHVIGTHSIGRDHATHGNDSGCSFLKPRGTGPVMSCSYMHVHTRDTHIHGLWVMYKSGTVCAGTVYSGC